MDWSRKDYLWITVMFLIAVWTLILMAPIHCKGSIDVQVMLNIFDGLRVNFEHFSIFGVNAKIVYLL